jgi:hypothetical protein
VAAGNGESELVSLLVAHGADPNFVVDPLIALVRWIFAVPGINIGTISSWPFITATINGSTTKLSKRHSFWTESSYCGCGQRRE